MSNPASRQQLHAELARLHDLALIVDDQDSAEQLIRVVGAVIALYDRHAVDDRGRCALCRPTRRVWWRRCHACTVHDAFTTYRVGISAVRGDT